MAHISITQGGLHLYNTRWLTSPEHKVAYISITQGGLHLYNTRWLTSLEHKVAHISSILAFLSLSRCAMFRTFLSWASVCRSLHATTCMYMCMYVCMYVCMYDNCHACIKHVNACVYPQYGVLSRTHACLWPCTYTLMYVCTSHEEHMNKHGFMDPMHA